MYICVHWPYETIHCFFGQMISHKARCGGDVSGKTWKVWNLLMGKYVYDCLWLCLLACDVDGCVLIDKKYDCLVQVCVYLECCVVCVMCTRQMYSCIMHTSKCSPTSIMRMMAIIHTHTHISLTWCLYMIMLWIVNVWANIDILAGLVRM